MYKYLSDKDFLKEVDCAKLKTLYIKLTALDWNENPIQDIQSSVVSGTLNIDGKSSIRRTCSLSIITNNVNVTELDNLFSLNKKVKLEIGYKNIFNKYSEYQILWFPQGIFVITSASISQTTNGITLGLQLKDKMCLLNGECGGVISYPAEIDVYDDVDENGKIVTKKIPMYKLIQEVVNHYGKEPLHKILVSDIDTRVKKVLSWYGDTPLYGEVEEGKKTVSNFTTIKPTENYYFLYESGDDIGYAYEDFYYPDTLNVNAGDNVCTILDKIKNALGNFEYFYDVEGNFIFREIKNYLNTSKVTSEIKEGKWKINIDNENYLMNASNSKSVYDFNDTNIIVSCANNPQYNMIKNDFIVCGQRKGLTGEKIPIFYHLAIDKKPETGITFKGFEYEDPDDGLVKFICPVEYNTLPIRGEQGLYYKLKNNDKVYIWDLVDRETNPHYDYKEIDVDLTTLTSHDWRTTLYLQGSQSTKAGLPANDYYEELRNEWPKVYDVMEGDYSIDIRNLNKLNFFLDFLDMNTNIAKFSISNIGKRSKVINDNKINCLFEQDIPDLFVIESGTPQTEYNRQECIQKKNDYVQVSQELYSNISNGGKMNSAFNLVQELLYQYTDYNESVSLQTLPILYLEPNSRVSLNNTAINLSGDYVINSLSIPLNVGGTMTISATKMIGPLEGTIVTDKPKPAPPEPIPPDPTPPPEPTPPRLEPGIYDMDNNLIKSLSIDDVGEKCFNVKSYLRQNNFFDYIDFKMILPEEVNEIGQNSFNWNSDSGFCGNLRYLFVPKNVVKVSQYAFYRNDLIREIYFEKDSQCESIEYYAFNTAQTMHELKVNLENCINLKVIGVRAFDTSGLREINIPESVETISDNAFSFCDNLTYANINTTSLGSYSFGYCYNLQKVDLKVDEIKSYAFYYCHALAKINLKAKTDKIKIYNGVFTKCYKLRSVDFNEISFIDSNVFEYSGLDIDTVVPDTIEIRDGAFSNVTHVFYNGLRSPGSKYKNGYIENDILYRSENEKDTLLAVSKNLKTIEIPSHIETIREYAFRFSDLTELYIPDTVKFVDNYCCASCHDLVSVNTGHLTAYMFYDCINLERVIFRENENITNISTYAFGYCENLKEIQIPSTVSYINEYAFYYCHKLSEIDFSQNQILSTISRYAFVQCNELRNITLPNSLQEIGVGTFSGCSNLNIVVPSSVYTIGKNAFSNVQHVEYHGTASGAPWGAKSIN